MSRRRIVVLFAVHDRDGVVRKWVRRSLTEEQLRERVAELEARIQARREGFVR